MSVRTEILAGSRGLPPQVGRARWKSVRGRLVGNTNPERTFFYLFLLHVPLGVLMYNFSALTVVHPAAVLAFGLYRAIQKNEPIHRVANVVAYMIGVEVLWRMAGAPVFWEFGKYGSALVMVVALLRRGYAQIPSLPLFYLVLLLPACFVTLYDNWSHVRARLSFNMSGPLCLFVSCWFFSRIKLTPVQLKHLLFSLSIPLVSVAIATLFFTVTNPSLEFTNESNPMTSGGFGPNQVSSMLGLGAFIAAAAILLFKNDLKTALFLGALALLFSAQSVLTFSRGGMYAAVGALAMLAIFLARNFSQFLYRILPVVAVAVIFMFVVFPNLNDFTGGKLEERFEDSDTTNRLSLLEMELQIFIENPFWGVGVGEAIDERYQMSRQFSASHTEFSRLLSEHGTFGILAITALIAGGVFNLRKQNTRIGKALVAGALAWSGLFMVNSGMRLAAPAFIWGLSCVMIASPIYANMASPNRWKRKPRQPAALPDRDQDALPGPTD